MGWTGAFRTWRSLESRRRWLLIEALVTVPVIILLLRLVHFSRIARWLGTPGHESSSQPDEEEVRVGAEIGWAVRAVARRQRGMARCLVQGLSASAIARRRGVSTTLYLGVARGQDDRLEAHAWVRCGEAIVTGRAGHRRYQVIERFARDGSLV